MKNYILYILALLLHITVYAQDIPVEEDSNDYADHQVFTVTEELPEFIGGEAALLEYMNSIEYPKEAMEKKMEGQPYARFTVAKDGNITDVEIAKSCGFPILDKALVKHVQNMPPWKPGTQNGKAVKVQYIIPVKFYLENRAPLPKQKNDKGKNKS